LGENAEKVIKYFEKQIKNAETKNFLPKKGDQLDFCFGTLAG
jgi:hypothetical protein